jgi:hypothetical protein
MVSDRFRLALQTALAMVLAYGIALAMDWDKPYWAAFAVGVCSLGSVGESLNKGVLRVLGTLAAVPLALGLLSLFPQDRWPFLLTLSLWTGFCAYMMGTTSRWYFWFVVGFSVPLLTIAGGGEPVHDFNVVVLRAQETLLGVLSFALVALLVLPVSSGAAFRRKVAALVAAERKLAAHYLAELALPRVGLTGPKPPADLEQTRAQATRLGAELPALLEAAELDTYEVWESRQLWRQALRDLEALHRLLEKVRLNRDELADTDVTRYLTGLAPSAAALDAKLADIEALLGEGGREPGARVDVPAAGPDPARLRLADDAASLGHFDRAALTVTRHQLAEVARCALRLHESVAAIRARAVRDDLLTGAGERRALVPDWERMRVVLRQQALFWFVALLVIYVPDVPLGEMALVIATSMSMMLVILPQFRPLTLIPPLLSGIVFGTVIHVLIMPQLAGFWALGTLLFAAVFWICWSNHLPSQMIGRSIGLTLLAMLMSVDNQQVYGFANIANLAVGAVLVVAVLALSTYFPLSFRAEDRFQALLKRWFHSAAWLLGTLGADAERAEQGRSRWFRWRLAAHRHAVGVIPRQLARWGGALPVAALGHATPADVEATVTAVQAMSDRIDELIRSRDLPQSPAMRRALAEDVRDWRLAVQALFAQLADAPDAADVAHLRERLDRKLRQVEQRTEQAMADDPDFDAELELSEHSYRLLGAYRGLSEALVRFAFRARMLDWPRLREARF